MADIEVQSGVPLEFGAVPVADGVNFSLFSRSAEKVVLVLFDSETDSRPSAEIEFDPVKNRTGDIWHIFIKGICAGALYLYKVYGEYNPPAGLRFNSHKYLFDPHAKAFTSGSVFLSYNRQRSMGLAGIENGELSDLSGFPKCVVVDDGDFDWEDDAPLNIPLEDTVIYEAHLRGFTASPSSGVEYPGTYRGFSEKTDYLKSLGITAVEFLPLFEFDGNENGNINPRTGERLTNFWGYSTIGFFAPKTSYAADTAPGAPVNEFKAMVKKLHKAGIEVILDVVFNHTAEGNEHGYTFGFRGIQNDIYYQLPPNERQYYMNFSGCGNTVNCNHPVVRDYIIGCLRYWVLQMHVDGFRFDLASILTRASDGTPIKLPPLTEAINEDPVLSRTKIIAEPWDAGGLYQLGCFPGGSRWCEWNGRFRDDIRRFIRGDEFTATAAATRIAGSSDLYKFSGRSPLASINFITAHDGFTMNDLVSYNYKHNDENGENNCDGSDDNLSYNHGYEGASSNPRIETQRIRKIKNFLLYLFVSQGVPMMTAGDEMRRTQHGNNNAYCQDNQTSWIDWNLAGQNSGLVRFTAGMINLRKTHPVFRRKAFFSDPHDKSSVPEITWFDVNGKVPDWSKMSRFLAFRLSSADDGDFYIAANMDIYDLTLNLPPLQNGKKWYRIADTSFESPADFMECGREELLREQRRYVLLSGSSIILISR